MKFSHRVWRCLCLLLSLLSWELCSDSAHAAAQPNIIVILSDDGGYNEYGFNAAVSSQNGGQTPTQAYTPRLDQLAAQSVIGRQAYAQPLCSESRVALLTGLSGQRLGLEENLGNDVNQKFGFASGQATMASRLKSLGYTTGMIGKWHEGYQSGINQPTDLGFDEFFGFLGGQRNYYGDNSPSGVMLRGKTNVESVWRTQGDTNEYDPVNGRYATDAFGEESVDFINNHANDAKPFFLYTAFNSPHAPNVVKSSDYNEPHVAAINDPIYPNKRALAALLYGMDRNVGKMMDALSANGIDNNTIVVFMNDNGGLGIISGGTNLGDDNAPLAGFKGLTNEGGIRVPFMIRAGAAARRLQLTDRRTRPAAYVCERGRRRRISVRHGRRGSDALLVGRDTDAPHPEAFWRNRGAWAVRKGDWKLARPGGTNVYGFYNMTTDQSEQVNLIGGLTGPNAAKIAEMFRDLTAWEATLQKPKYGILGADDRNKFDHFVFRNNLAATTNFSGTGAWQEFGNPAHTVTMLVDDAYANNVIEFTTRDDASYTANNNMLRMSGRILHAQPVADDRQFWGRAAQSGTVSGFPLLFVKNLNGQAPRIQLDATASDATSFTFNLNSELDLFDDLTIAGNGTQNFVIGGAHSGLLRSTCSYHDDAAQRDKTRNEQRHANRQQHIYWRPYNQRRPGSC